MKKHLIKFNFLILLFFLVSCEKEYIQKLEFNNDFEIISNSKTWYDNITKNSKTIISNKDQLFKFEYNLNWEDAISAKIDIENIILIPVATNLEKITGKDNLYAVLIREKNGEYEIKNLSIDFQSEENKNNLNLKEIYEITFKSKTITSNIKKILIYNENFILENSFELKGNELNKTSNIKTNEVRSRPICYDYYLVRHHYNSNGELLYITEQYIGTQCEEVRDLETIDHLDPDGSSSGGGTLIDATSLSIAPNSAVISSIIDNSNPEERMLNYSWVALENIYTQLKINSYETGVHKKVGTSWHWKSLSHINVSASNQMSFQTVEIVENGTAIPTIGTTAAGMSINITARVYYGVNGFSIGYPSVTHNLNSPVFYSTN